MNKAFDNIKQSKSFDILKTIGIKYYDRKCVYNVYKNQTLFVHIDEKEEEAKIKAGVWRGCNLSIGTIEQAIDDHSIILKLRVKLSLGLEYYIEQIPT